MISLFVSLCLSQSNVGVLFVTSSLSVCKSLDRSITENKEKKSDAGIDESAQAERQRGREAEH